MRRRRRRNKTTDEEEDDGYDADKRKDQVVEIKCTKEAKMKREKKTMKKAIMATMAICENFVELGRTSIQPHFKPVAHYIGQDRNVILCIKDLTDGVVVDGEELTPRAVKDYNRGRQYLADVASRERVPIFEDVTEATHALVERIKRDQEKVMRENPSPSHHACHIPATPQNPGDPRSPMSSCLGL
ncbi:uncharacterized protein LOC115929299 [Strongylocentrotus purpuratus]|uniref:Uncharacterized protein n=1 Tax=Strongylocentrotus purpuratus TaxID=7668 RepID=A0A7M7PNX7_STRPU|nr:uncharacterized protein LOC115929299 [Strongylocentrotus purpuratus]